MSIMRSVTLSLLLFLASSCQPTDKSEVEQFTISWEQMGEVLLSGDYFELQVETTGVCCGSSTEQGGSPIKIYLAPFDDPQRMRPEALCIYLGMEDRVVVSKERERGWFADEIYRATGPARRSTGWVVLRIPRNVLPNQSLRLCLGRSHAVKIGDVLLGSSHRNVSSTEVVTPFVLLRQN